METSNSNLKKMKMIYWIFTLIALLFDSGGAVFFNSPMAIEGTRHLGFPDYFRVELGIGKIMGGLIILIPAIPHRLKEWAYVGFGIACISAVIADYIVDGPAMAAMPLIFLIIFVVSYIYYHKIRKAKGLEV